MCDKIIPTTSSLRGAGTSNDRGFIFGHTRPAVKLLTDNVIYLHTTPEQSWRAFQAALEAREDDPCLATERRCNAAFKVWEAVFLRRYA